MCWRNLLKDVKIKLSNVDAETQRLTKKGIELQITFRSLFSFYTLDIVAMAIITVSITGGRVRKCPMIKGSMVQTSPLEPEKMHRDSLVFIPIVRLKDNSNTEPPLSLSIAKPGQSVH